MRQVLEFLYRTQNYINIFCFDKLQSNLKKKKRSLISLKIKFKFFNSIKVQEENWVKIDASYFIFTKADIFRCRLIRVMNVIQAMS